MDKEAQEKIVIREEVIKVLRTKGVESMYAELTATPDGNYDIGGCNDYLLRLAIEIRSKFEELGYRKLPEKPPLLSDEENKAMKTAKDSYKLASKMWAEKMPAEDLFDFVRRLLNDLYKLSEEVKE